MIPFPFDGLTRALGRRTTRRSAIAGGMVGIAAGIATRRHAAAQDATPVAFPDDPHPSAGTDPTGTEFLFTQSFQSGTWAPKAGEEGVYTLTLSDVPSQIVYFSDRPERIFGVAPTQQFLDGLGFTPANPPNAALVAQSDTGSADEEVLVIELLNPVYDPDTATMTYDAKILADYSGHGLAHAAHRQSDYSLPESFAHGSLFIDDCTILESECMGSHDNFCGYAYIQACWDASVNACVPCPGDEDIDSCLQRYPNCN